MGLGSPEKVGFKIFAEIELLSLYFLNLEEN